MEQEYIRGQMTEKVASHLEVAKDYKGCRTCWVWLAASFQGKKSPHPLAASGR